MISRTTIDQVMDTMRIEDVVGDYVSLKRRGSNMLGLCPFHNEKTPSFNVSPQKGIFKCFGCGQAGNSIKFLMELEKFSYPETIKYLAKKYSINVEEDEQPDDVRQEIQERESMLLANQWAASFFQEQMWDTDLGQTVALSYFRERGFTDETIKEFGLGFHPEGYTLLADAAKKAGYNLNYFAKTGLSIEKDGRYFDRFRNRVMFPIRNTSGKVIGFGGRILGNDKKVAKYLNSPESDVYHKSSVLYGLYEAKKAISNEDEAILVEGYTDVISLHQAGIQNAVASSGTSLTTEQIRLIRRYTQNVTILFDGDSAGIKASFRGLDMILEQGLNVKIIPLPKGEDPDSFARGNSTAFIKEHIRREAKDFISFKTSVLKDEAAGDPIKTAGMIREIVHSLAIIPDPILRSLYLKECSLKLDMDEQTLIFEMNRQIKDNQQKAYKSSSQSSGYSSAPNANDFPQDVPPDDYEYSGDGSITETANTFVHSTALAQENDIIRILIQFSNNAVIYHETNEEGEREDHVYRVGDILLNELVSDELYPLDQVNMRIFNSFVEAGQEDFPVESFFLHNDDQEIANRAIELTTTQHTLSLHWRERHQIHITNEEDLTRKMVLSAAYSFKFRRVEGMLNDVNQKLRHELPEEIMMKYVEECMGLQQAKLELARQLSYVIV
jgi:DNA primase